TAHPLGLLHHQGRKPQVVGGQRRGQAGAGTHHDQIEGLVVGVGTLSGHLDGSSQTFTVVCTMVPRTRGRLRRTVPPIGTEVPAPPVGGAATSTAPARCPGRRGRRLRPRRLLCVGPRVARP